MHPNAELIDRFYTAFARRDADAMVACYASDVVFSDPAFGELRGARAGAMWRMLCERGKDLRVEHRVLDADDAGGRAHWDAWYSFSKTGRSVHNVVEARFRIREGKIVEHRDAFGFWRWSRQALGPAGLLLGWTPVLQSAVRREALRGLDAYMAQGQR
jgi:ketosteroid isomerase-like protein